MFSTAGSQLEILQSWGVASARQPSGCTVSSLGSSSSASTQENVEYLYDISIGPSVVRWDIQNRKKVVQFQAHPDVITGLCKSPNGKFIATSSYSGTVKLWTSEWVCLCDISAPMSSQHYLAWSADSLRLVWVGNGLHSAVIVYDIVIQPDNRPGLKLAWTLHPSKDSEASCNAIAEEELDMSGRNYPYVTSYYMAEFNPNGNLFAIKELPYQTAVVQLLSPEGEELKSADLLAAMKEKDYARRPVQTMFTSTFHDGVYAIGIQGGRVALVDAEKLDVIVTFSAGSGFRTCMWDGDYLLLPSDSGTVSWWSREGEKVEEMWTGVQGLVVHVALSLSGNGIWFCGVNYMTFFDVERNGEGKVTAIMPVNGVDAHGITSVGVDFSPSGNYVGSGDILGCVWVTEKEKAEPLHTCSVDGSVRCLCWLSEDELLVGTLSGGLYWWTTSESEPKLSIQLEGSVICIHLNHQKKVLAVGTSTGDLLVYSVPCGSSGEELVLLASMKAHTPHSGPQDKRFGQLGQQAEVWNLCWSPDDIKIATCSEDQTVKVWGSQDLKSLVKLTGHVLAVTCVDWVQCGAQTLLASCSDDRTVRLYDGESYALLDIVNSKDIYGWHTLTYLIFFHIEDTIALLCTTQNGHVVLWKLTPDKSRCSESSDNLKEKEERWLVRQWKGKLHLGSIEGLAWQSKVDNGSLVTVGGDCVVNLFRLHI